MELLSMWSIVGYVKGGCGWSEEEGSDDTSQEPK
jgi:hypothetical protein